MEDQAEAAALAARLERRLEEAALAAMLRPEASTAVGISMSPVQTSLKMLPKADPARVVRLPVAAVAMAEQVETAAQLTAASWLALALAVLVELPALA